MERTRTPDVRIVALIGALAALPVVLLTAVIVLSTPDDRTGLRRELEVRTRAAHASLAAISELRKADESRAAELGVARATSVRVAAEAAVLSLTIDAASDVAGANLPAGGLVIDVAADRIVRPSSGTVPTERPFRAAHPKIAAALDGRTDEAFTIEQWAIGPLFNATLRAAVPIAPPAPVRTRRDLDQLAGALVSASTPPPEVAESVVARTIAIGLAMALIAGLLAMGWAWRSISVPVAEALESASRWAHGDLGSRPDASSGGSLARDVGRTLNGVMDSASRAKEERHGAIEGGVETLVAALGDLGRGDLTIKEPAVSAALEPIARAYGQSSEALRVRLLDLHRLSVEVAASSANVTQGARRMCGSAAEQVAAVCALGDEARAAGEEVGDAANVVKTALDGLGGYTAAHRKVGQQIRAALGIAARRASDLWLAAGQLEKSLAGASAIDESLDVLESLAMNPGSDSDGQSQLLNARATACVRRGRQATELLKREVASLREDMEDVAQSLDLVQADLPEGGADVERSVTAPLHETALAFARATERLLGAVGAIERSMKATESGMTQVLAGAKSAADVAPLLDSALTELDLGDSVEADVLQRLERAHEEINAAQSQEELTATSQAIVDEMAQAAEKTRARLSRLIAATEATADSVRNS